MEVVVVVVVAAILSPAAHILERAAVTMAAIAMASMEDIWTRGWRL